MEGVYQKRGFCVPGVSVCTSAPACELPVMSVCSQVCVYIFFVCPLLWTVTVFRSGFLILSLKLSPFGGDRIQITCFAVGPIHLAWLFNKTTQCKPVRFPSLKL